jgi:hypothetical protein
MDGGCRTRTWPGRRAGVVGPWFCGHTSRSEVDVGKLRTSVVLSIFSRRPVAVGRQQVSSMAALDDSETAGVLVLFIGRQCRRCRARPPQRRLLHWAVAGRRAARVQADDPILLPPRTNYFKCVLLNYSATSQGEEEEA